ncbi:lytic transglycosylase domain-containing protein [Streptosporangium sp. NPDC000239]|uniref:Lytic transglycosylase domain-containing protein n=1 Tax=Streptosporangium jomthongense TaxID=1193683 RepID=A0ABV8FDE7_9ACTN
MKEPRAPRSRRTARSDGTVKPRGWLTPKRAVIIGTSIVVVVGGGGFTVHTAIQNASATSSASALSVDELARVFGGGDPFAPDPKTDVMKAQAAQAAKEDKLKAARGDRDPLDPIVIPKKAPGGNGFDPKAFPPGSANPTGNKALGKSMLEAMGWGDQWGCLEKLWMKESGWNERAMNRYSGAYGIPQSLPGSKMASAGSDWQVNPATQIQWGLTYIKGRYGTPCGAWGHSQATGWY